LLKRNKPTLFKKKGGNDGLGYREGGMDAATLDCDIGIYRQTNKDFCLLFIREK